MKRWFSWFWESLDDKATVTMSTNHINERPNRIKNLKNWKLMTDWYENDLMEEYKLCRQ